MRLPLALLVAALLALAAPFALARQEVSPPSDLWEYRAVGVSELYGSTLEYLKGAIGKAEGILGAAKAADDQLVAKTQDLLNELGAEGWELAHYSNNMVIMKRPAR